MWRRDNPWSYRDSNSDSCRPARSQSLYRLSSCIKIVMRKKNSCPNYCKFRINEVSVYIILYSHWDSLREIKHYAVHFADHPSPHVVQRYTKFHSDRRPHSIRIPTYTVHKRRNLYNNIITPLKDSPMFYQHTHFPDDLILHTTD
jgi:hypothetical protein